MAKLELDIDTTLPPDKVMAALTDFTERRPDLWPGLAREYYEVYSKGEASAEVREGSVKPTRVWAKEHYDWSTPGKVTWTVKESNFCRPGSNVSAQIQAGPERGSRIHMVWERWPSNMKGRLIIGMLVLSRGSPITSSTKKALDSMTSRTDL
jgi:hypothetical protein